MITKTNVYSIIPSDFVHKKWEFLVVGTGMGGSTLGYRLAKAGKKVLFLEKGRSHLEGRKSLAGNFPEILSATEKTLGEKEASILKDAGRYCEEIIDLSIKKKKAFIPFIGSGTGGSSALYGAVLERFSPSDFLPQKTHRGGTSTVTERWPITFEELVPYYEAAEQLYGINAKSTQLSLTAAAQEFISFFKKKGLHPYRLPVACDTSKNCPGCQGYLCDKGCKNDSAKICLEPALKHHGTALLTQTEVIRLESSARKVTGVVVENQGREFILRADLVILAAGALETPRILLNSVSEEWPHGLGNTSDLVGRNLMRHLVDLYVVRPKNKPDPNTNPKEIGIGDYYEWQGKKYGTIQSFGKMLPIPMVLSAVEKNVFSNSAAMSFLFRCIRPLLTIVLHRFFKDVLVFAATLEDSPTHDNRVSLSEGRIAIHYRVPDEDKQRVSFFRSLMKKTFHPYKVHLIKQAENNERIAHVCGTCRFGDEPKTSVLNRWNQVHGVDNLYVVDGSFFPSSGGTNPALTIAANALRVGDYLLKAEVK